MTDTEIIFAIEESPEGGFEARALGHAIFTQADTIDELKVMLRDAVECHFDGAVKPRVIRLHWTKDEVIPA
ncbi:MAG TPA: 2-oxoisovalerate dehydrogenase [Candidatus Binatia bacterium]|nr:2-oxoisovalerate dehydrogenase [Candidatus Binatia bacterium]